MTHVANCAVVTLNQIEANYTFALVSSCNRNMASEKCISCWEPGGWEAFHVSDPEERSEVGLLEGVG